MRPAAPSASPRLTLRLVAARPDFEVRPWAFVLPCLPNSRRARGRWLRHECAVLSAPCSPLLRLLPWRSCCPRAAALLGAALGLRHLAGESAYLHMQIRSPGSRGGLPQCSPASLEGEGPDPAPCRGSLAGAAPVGVATTRARQQESRAVCGSDPAAPGPAARQRALAPRRLWTRYKSAHAAMESEFSQAAQASA